MENQNSQKDTQIQSSDKSDAALEAEVKQPKRPFRWSLFFIFMCFMLVLVSLGSAAFNWYQLEQYKKANLASSAKLEQTINNKLDAKDVTSQVTPLVKPIQSTVQGLIQKANKAQQQRQSLTESTQKLFELYGRDKNGWQLAEVEYLLRIAQHRLIIENDFQGAAKTLKAADDKISEIADPGLLPVRVAISDERVLLQSRTRPDLVGMVLSLTRIIKQIPLLKITINKTKAVKPIASKQGAAAFTSDGDWMQQGLAFVKGLVKVEPINRSISQQSVQSIDVEQQLDENLNLAKWAILDRDQIQFKQLMQQSVSIFGDYYNLEDNYHLEIKDELQRLADLQIKPDLPDISHSLVLLKQVMQRREHALKQQRQVGIKVVEESAVQMPAIDIIEEQPLEKQMHEQQQQAGENNE